jgi:hypothetical protein
MRQDSKEIVVRTVIADRIRWLAAGEEAQVESGTCAPILRTEGYRKRPHVFRMVLSFSRKACPEAAHHQMTEILHRRVGANWHPGAYGVSRTEVPQRYSATRRTFAPLFTVYDMWQAPS